MKAKSFMSEGKVYANLSDMDMYKLLGRVASYINAWEKSIGPQLIIQAKNTIAKRQAERRAA